MREKVSDKKHANGRCGQSIIEYVLLFALVSVLTLMAGQLLTSAKEQIPKAFCHASEAIVGKQPVGSSRTIRCNGTPQLGVWMTCGGDGTCGETEYECSYGIPAMVTCRPRACGGQPGCEKIWCPVQPPYSAPVVAWDRCTVAPGS